MPISIPDRCKLSNYVELRRVSKQPFPVSNIPPLPAASDSVACKSRCRKLGSALSACESRWTWAKKSYMPSQRARVSRSKLFKSMSADRDPCISLTSMPRSTISRNFGSSGGESGDHDADRRLFTPALSATLASFCVTGGEIHEGSRWRVECNVSDRILMAFQSSGAVVRQSSRFRIFKAMGLT